MTGCGCEPCGAVRAVIERIHDMVYEGRALWGPPTTAPVERPEFPIYIGHDGQEHGEY